MQRLEDRVDDGIEFRLYITIPEPQDTVTCRSEETVSPIVIRAALEMLAAVQFDDDPAIEGGKVADVEANLMLTTKLEATDLPPTETTPEETFRIGLVMAKIACTAEHAGIEARDLGDRM